LEKKINTAQQIEMQIKIKPACIKNQRRCIWNIYQIFLHQIKN